MKNTTLEGRAKTKNGGTSKMRKRYQKIDEQLLPLLPENHEILEKLQQSIPKAGNISSYIYGISRDRGCRGLAEDPAGAGRAGECRS